jgi:recombination protein RecA
MPKKSPKRTPVKRTPVGRATKSKKGPKIKKDLIEEYRESVREKGVVEVLTLSDDDCLAHVKQHVSTQSLALDKLFNGRGVPTGRVLELYGPPHIGKSTLIDHALAECQKQGGISILLDTEGARDLRYSQSIGVDPKKLLYYQFDPKELHIENVITQIYRTVDFWREKDPNRLVVIGWDALGGTATRDELEKGLERNERPAMAASILRKAARQLPPKLGNTNIALMIANHEYEKLNLGSGGGGKKKETYGGKAVQHLSTIRVQFYNGGWIKGRGGEVIGRKVGANLVKNRLGNPFGSTEFAMISGIGIDNVWTLYESLKQAGVIVVSGSWSALNLDGEVLKFQGWLGLAEKCKEDDTLFPRLVSVYLSLD